MPAVLAIPAVPALEAALIALAGILGIGLLSEEQTRRQRAASEAGAGAAAQTATDTHPDACTQCPPDCGMLVTRNWHMSEDARAYQARVTGFPPRQEWSWAAIDFDGFSSRDCTLREAKARYDQFLEEDDDGGAFRPKPFYTAFEKKMLPQARTQASAARGAPPARLHWYFQGIRTYEYMSPVLNRIPPLQAYYQP